MGRDWKASRIFLWLGGTALALLFLLGIANLLAPHAVQRLLVGPVSTPAPTFTPGPPKAAILDQTGVTNPSPDFIEKASGLLAEGGFEVTVHPWEELSVDFYRTLPGEGYRLIIFQTHSTSAVGGSDGEPLEEEYPPGPFIFTGEEASDKYLYERMRDRIRRAWFLYGDYPPYFAIGPEFVRSSMSGLFPGTVIIIGGCQSLAVPDLAQAFLERGASVVIGWDGLVDLSHNNRAMLCLLQALVVDGLPPQMAVQETMKEIGPDPTYGSVLLCVP